MAVVKSFKCVRPVKELAEQVASLPYDVYDRKEAKAAVSGKPYAFLNIDRPETAFDDSFDMYSKEAYEKAKNLYEEFKNKGIYEKDNEDGYYLYELTMKGRSQIGIVGLASVDDYLNDIIKKHENTREEKEIDRIKHVDTVNAQTGPIFLAYKNRDIRIFLNKRTPKVQKIGSKIILTIEDRTSNQRDVIQADNILIVPGIIPNTDLLNLKDTTIVTDEKGWIKTNEFLETSAKDIFAFGDINGEAQFRHKANYEADILAHNLSKPYKEWRFANYDNVPSVIFSNPEVSSVGLSENEAKNKGYDIVIAKNKYSQTAKGFALGYDDSDSSSEAFAKLIIDKNSNHILGFHAVGHYSSTLLQPFVNLLGAGDLVHQVINPSIESENSKIAR